MTRQIVIKERETLVNENLQRIIVAIKKFDGKCFNCDKKGNMAKDCWSKKKKLAESNTNTSSF